MGLVQAENIQVIAEAYDVALDISFPKGTKNKRQALTKCLFLFTLEVGEKWKIKEAVVCTHVQLLHFG